MKVFKLLIAHHFEKMLLQEWKRRLDPEEEMERPVGPGVRELVVPVVEKLAEPGVELVVT